MVAWSDVVPQVAWRMLGFAWCFSLEELWAIELQVHTKQHFLLPASPRDPCCSSKGGGEPASQQHLSSSGQLLLGNLPWLALPFPIPVFSSDFCAGCLRKTDGCVWWLLLLGKMWEKGCGEKRTRGALRVQRWEGATATAWQWVAASPKMVPNPWSGLCSCGDWILQAFFQLLSEE